MNRLPDTPTSRAVFNRIYLEKMDELLISFPELAEDQKTLRDTLEGITHAPDLIAQIIRDARQDEAYSGALAIMVREMSDRKARFEHRANCRRLAAQHLMDELGLRKLEQADFTASIRAVPPKIEIEEDSLLPDELCKIIRSPDKAAIKAALEIGSVPGARMTNGGETLSVRVK